MILHDTPLDGLLHIAPRVFGDQRGFFMETWHSERYRDIGIPRPFVQDNLSFSRKGILRGLHYQLNHPQGKLVMAITGAIFDVAVDIRKRSPDFGKWYGVILSEENRHQLFVPEGFAHGFCVLSETAHVCYKCTDLYHPEDEGGVLYNDPGIGISWPVTDVTLSDKDRVNLPLAAIAPERLPD
ncbi:MAG: dTDP-4-dehydrorhamnose 3,5-epimerase [Deltaproteobacteria bacterium]|nr:MAG: dTDP-4-dehydrorhamnose 3,5-epimerase [Deltaproteobacteria bacterium]